MPDAQGDGVVVGHAGIDADENIDGSVVGDHRLTFFGTALPAGGTELDCPSVRSTGIHSTADIDGGSPPVTGPY